MTSKGLKKLKFNCRLRQSTLISSKMACANDHSPYSMTGGQVRQLKLRIILSSLGLSLKWSLTNIWTTNRRDLSHQSSRLTPQRFKIGPSGRRPSKTALSLSLPYRLAQYSCPPDKVLEPSRHLPLSMTVVLSGRPLSKSCPQWTMTLREIFQSSYPQCLSRHRGQFIDYNKSRK